MSDAKSQQSDLLSHRLRAGLTQRQLARLLGVSEFQVYRYERRARPPHLTDALKLAVLYGTSVEALFSNLMTRARRRVATFLKTRSIRQHAHLKDVLRSKRVLAVDPWSRGLGVAVLYDEVLVVCRVRNLRGPPLPDRLLKNGIAAVENLIHVYRPGVLVLPRFDGPYAHRSPHVQAFCRAVRRLAQQNRVHVIERNRKRVAAELGVHRNASRHRLAEVVAARFPSTRPKLPPPRKPWQPQDLRLSRFYAVALAIAARPGKFQPH